MARRTKGTSPGTRVAVGAAILAAARGVDTSRVRERLAGFARAHRRYLVAQRKLDAAEGEVRAARARVAACDALHGDAVDRLARALIADGASLRNPFAACGAPAPGAVVRLPLAERARAVHALAETIGRRRDASVATREAARAAEQAARRLEAALAEIAPLEARVASARRTRDVVGVGWETAIATLRLACRAAAYDGAQLYEVLFAPFARARARAAARDSTVAADVGGEAVSAAIGEEVPRARDAEVAPLPSERSSTRRLAVVACRDVPVAREATPLGAGRATG
jgi:hypothetical protein